MDQLLKEWRECHDDMVEDTAEIQAQMDVLTAALGDIAAPYREQMAGLEAEIKTVALARGEGYKAENVAVSYRKGYERVSYDSKQTNVVLGVLRDVLPETAKSLEGARKVSYVSPSVTVKAI